MGFPRFRAGQPILRRLKSKARPGRLLRTRECHSALNAMRRLRRECQAEFGLSPLFTASVLAGRVRRANSGE